MTSSFGVGIWLLFIFRVFFYGSWCSFSNSTRWKYIIGATDILRIVEFSTIRISKYFKINKWFTVWIVPILMGNQVTWEDHIWDVPLFVVTGTMRKMTHVRQKLRNWQGSGFGRWWPSSSADDRCWMLFIFPYKFQTTQQVAALMGHHSQTAASPVHRWTDGNGRWNKFIRCQIHGPSWTWIVCRRSRLSAIGTVRWRRNGWRTMFLWRWRMKFVVFVVNHVYIGRDLISELLSVSFLKEINLHYNYYNFCYWASQSPWHQKKCRYAEIYKPDAQWMQMLKMNSSKSQDAEKY